MKRTNVGLVVAAHAQGQKGVQAALRAGVDTIEHSAEMTPEITELFLDNPRSLHGTSGLVPTLMAALPIVKLDYALTQTSEVVRASGRLVLEQMIRGLRDAVENGIDIWRELDFVVRFGGQSPPGRSTPPPKRMPACSDLKS